MLFMLLQARSLTRPPSWESLCIVCLLFACNRLPPTNNNGHDKTADVRNVLPPPLLYVTHNDDDVDNDDDDQNTEGMLGQTSSGGTMRVRKLAKERLVNAGTVVGLDEQLMKAPYQCTYTTASFVHLFFFDKTQVSSNNISIAITSAAVVA